MRRPAWPAITLALLTSACGATPPRPSTAPTFVELGRGRGAPVETSALTIPPTGDCGGLARLPRQRTAMLEGRATLVLPPADVHGMPHSIMAAEPSREWNELAWIESGSARMAVVATEALRAVEGDLVESVSGWAPPTTTVERASDDLVAAFASPPALRGDDVRLARIYVRDTDDLIVMIDVITDPENAERGGCVELAREIAASVAVGDRRVMLGARTIDFAGLALDVPAGFASSIDEGPDFDVLHVEAIARVDGGPFATLGLYAGDHPSFAPGETAAVTRDLLGSQVPFFDTNEEGTHRREGMITSGRLAYHLFFSANDDALFESLDSVARSLRLP